VAEVNILLVEDDEVDVKAVKRALKDLKILNSLTVATDGIDALQILRGQNGREPLKRPYAWAASNSSTNCAATPN
jgi:CheY-like chemotaxis protein